MCRVLCQSRKCLLFVLETGGLWRMFYHVEPTEMPARRHLRPKSIKALPEVAGEGSWELMCSLASTDEALFLKSIASTLACRGALGAGFSRVQTFPEHF